MGLVTPVAGYLQGLRDLCTKENIILIFDEVMTGFRLAKGGAQERFGVIPDMTTLGKIIGGGFPVGAYGGKKEIMEAVAPAGPVYQAGTLSGNPVAMAAGLRMLTYLNEHDEVYNYLENISEKMVFGMRQNLAQLGLEYTINQVGSMFSIFFTRQPVTDLESAKKSNLQLFSRYFNSMLRRGIYLAPSQYESLFISTALTDQLADEYLAANLESLKELKAHL
jgi:glutamate-1-semialdehyde 2,1-aminomutase